MSKDIQCPYCDEWIEDDGECNEPDTNFDQECPKCGKTFGFTVDYTKNYYEYKTPCRNGEPHDWKPIIGCPAEYFADKRRCSYCGDETTVSAIEAQRLTVCGGEMKRAEGEKKVD